MHDSLNYLIATCKSLSSCAICSQELLESLLNRKIPLSIKVDASVSKIAAEKGSTRNMKYISKTQQIDLIWIRDILQFDGIDIEKVSTHDNLADVMTKFLGGPKIQQFYDGVGLISKPD